ncbi:MAG TPA: leucine--tRNA ligase [Streptosporangiaceae bacterium]|jgi:leucyl-tRNA synthetase|nr:leucine--tRNA ligase [Streptosporangiaceae bacterium]
MGYDFRAVEAKWRERWHSDPPAHFDLRAVDPAAKFYNLVEFPYPSAEGLHVGHVYTYCGADTLGRYLTMNGRQVFQPMGWDSFGIHTENFALKIGEKPRVLTDRATRNYRRQLERVGANWTWDSELRTDDPRYYHWTQWIFLQLYRAGLAVRREAPVIWCPSCLTVLAFEQVDGDACERCGTVVTQKVMKQWFLRITAYADALLDTLPDLDWPELSKRLQREWIGRSAGVSVTFGLRGGPAGELTAFTTRADTLLGVTFVAVAPEHPVVAELAGASANGDEIRDYAERALGVIGAVRGTERLASAGPGVPGVRTDVLAVHPLTGEEVPVVVADYVLAGYGTGVVMGVPAHDQRDYEFARRLGLPARVVIAAAGGPAPEGEADERDGVLTESGEFDGLSSAAARERIAARLAELGRGGPATQYRLHDWLVSRQRYWGSPIPIVYCDACGEQPVPESQLPVVLPDIEDFRPSGTGESPLAAVPDFVPTTCPGCDGPAVRETDVFDTFVESSWYFLRYPSYDRADVPWDPELTRQMLPVDMYAGGREHATRHHLYARFVTRALHDLGHLPFAEPFRRLRLHGLVISGGAKMSKSRGNVVNPDEYIDRVGADNLRGYLLFCGPWEQGGDFSDRSLNGVVRFNGRLFDLLTKPSPGGPGGADLRALDRAIDKVGHDIENLKFNTALAELMSLANWLRDSAGQMNDEEWNRARRVIVLLLAPLEPFLAEELWSLSGEPDSVHRQRWPVADPAALVVASVTIPVQVNGRVCGRIEVGPDAPEAAVTDAALALPAVREALGGGRPGRVVYVPGRIISLVR